MNVKILAKVVKRVSLPTTAVERQLLESAISLDQPQHAAKLMNRPLILGVSQIKMLVMIVS